MTLEDEWDGGLPSVVLLVKGLTVEPKWRQILSNQFELSELKTKYAIFDVEDIPTILEWIVCNSGVCEVRGEPCRRLGCCVVA